MADTKRWRAAVVGVGRMGQQYAAAFATYHDTELVALVDGNDDGIEFVKAKIQEAQKMQDDKNVKSEIMTEDAASADVLEKLENL